MTDRSLKASLKDLWHLSRCWAARRLFDQRFDELWSWPSAGAAMVIRRQAEARRKRVAYELGRASRELAVTAARAGRPRDQGQSGPGDQLAQR